jgi:uncharacterized protein (UPF0548 family)
MTPDLDALADAELTYPQHGATRNGTLPDGYHHLSLAADLGTGQAVFDLAASALLHWDMHRRAGLRIDASGPSAEPGVVVAQTVGWGPLALTSPCRVVYTVDDQDRRGFGYGTLPGHPETGEESFAVELAPDGTVRLRLRSFSKPATLMMRAAGPAGAAVQRFVVVRYVRALRALANPGGPSGAPPERLGRLLRRG